MTVWIVNPFDNLPTEGYRPQRYWLMAEAFVRAGHAVVYWTSDFNHGTKAKRKKIGVENRCRCPADGLEVVEIPTRPYPKNVCWARVKSHFRLARDFERMAKGRSAPDLVIASTPPLGLCDAARRVAKSCGARFVCDIMDAWPETFGRLLPSGFKWLGALVFAPLRRTARRLYREADLVTGVSARYKALSGRADFYLAYHGIATSVDAKSVRVPVDAKSVRVPVDAKSVRVETVDAKSVRVIYLGNLGAGYDLETVIDAVARRTDLTLDIAGRGPKEAALRARVTARGLADRVRFHGYLGTDELQALLAACDVGVIPLRDDSWVGLPYKLCDYLKAGLPVLSSLHGECGELLTRTGFGATYGFGDPDSFLRALDGWTRVPVSLPDDLRADSIYARYVGRCAGAGGDVL